MFEKQWKLRGKVFGNLIVFLSCLSVNLESYGNIIPWQGTPTMLQQIMLMFYVVNLFWNNLLFSKFKKWTIMNKCGLYISKNEIKSSFSVHIGSWIKKHKEKNHFPYLFFWSMFILSTSQYGDKYFLLWYSLSFKYSYSLNIIEWLTYKIINHKWPKAKIWSTFIFSGKLPRTG